MESMTIRKLCLAAAFCAFPALAQEYKMAVVGLVHSHVWGHLNTMLKGDKVKLVGIAESNPELVSEAKKRDATNVAFYDDYKMMLAVTKPALVWSCVENDRHLRL